MEVTVKIEGLKEAEAAMKLLPERLAKRAGAEAVRAGAAVFRKSMLAKVPIRGGKPKRRGKSPPTEPGNLKRSIDIKMLTKGRSPLKINALIGPTIGPKSKNDGWYGRLVEKGHKVVPRRAKASNVGIASHRRASSEEYGSRHVPAHPFIRPAFDESQQAAEQAMMDKLGAAIEKQANIFAYGRKK